MRVDRPTGEAEMTERDESGTPVDPELETADSASRRRGRIRQQDESTTPREPTLAERRAPRAGRAPQARGGGTARSSRRRAVARSASASSSVPASPSGSSP